MNEQQIIDILESHRGSARYHIRNAYVFAPDWESDFLKITQTGYSDEYEVKISVADFLRDLKKRRHEIFMTGGYIKQTTYNRAEERWNTAFQSMTFTPNRFWYAVPAGLLAPENVPAYAGLIYMTLNKSPLIIKQAPLRHRIKQEYERRLCMKYFMNLAKAKDTIWELRQQLANEKAKNDRALVPAGF